MGDAALGYTPGAGSAVAADMVDLGPGPAAVEYVKILDGAEDGTDRVLVQEDYGMRVDPTRRRAAPSTVPVLSTSIYAADDVLFEPVEITGAGRDNLGTGQINAVTLTDAAKQASEIDLYFFATNPTAVFTVNTPFVPTLGAVQALVGKVHIDSADYETTTHASWVQAVLPAPIPYVCGVTSLWVVGVTRGTPTYATASDLTLLPALTID